MGRLALIIIAVSALVAFLMPSPDKTSVVTRPTIVQTAPASSSAIGQAATVSSGFGQEVALERGPSGHFRTEASVNGQPLTFVVDTGADMVALTIEDARRAGLYVDPSSFTVVAEGASGPVRGKEYTLDRVEVAGRTVEHVRAAVLEGLGQNLLGQSVLAQLGGVEMKGDKMVLR